MNPNPDLRILLIDDDAMVRSIVDEYLRSIGFRRVVVMPSGDRALKFMQRTKEPIGLIISDWEMPDMNGLALLKAVRANRLRRKTNFIMITSQRSMEKFKITQAAQAGVNSYIVKPFRMETLRKKIWEVMGWPDEEKDVA